MRTSSSVVLITTLFAAPLVSFGCSGSSTSDASSAASGAGGHTTSDVSSVASSASAGGASSSSGSGGGNLCGTTMCTASEYCGNCNQNDQLGQPPKCMARPNSCTPDPIQVCGCDGKVYPNACTAQMTGFDIGSGCTAPSGQFSCGSIFCMTATEFCTVSVPIADGTTSYECDPLPACDAGDACTCIPMSNQNGQCQQPMCTTKNGATTLQCHYI